MNARWYDGGNGEYPPRKQELISNSTYMKTSSCLAVKSDCWDESKMRNCKINYYQDFIKKIYDDIDDGIINATNYKTAIKYIRSFYYQKKEK